jgi:hypothetical protein
MSKYQPLGEFLRGQSHDRVPMTFSEIERVVRIKLPPSKRRREWWSNNPNNNVMTRQWLDAGFKTESVDIAGEKLVFRKLQPVSPVGERHPIFGCMKGLLTLADGFDPAAPMDLEDDWDAKYDAPSLPE